MADDDEGMKGSAKNGGGMWFRADVPSKDRWAVLHMGKPGPVREEGYGYPGISLWSSADVTSKSYHKHFFNSDSEFISVSGWGTTMVSRSTVDVVATVAVDIGSPGTLWLTAVKSGNAAKYATLESGGSLVKTDRGHGTFVDARNMVYQKIKSYQSWASAIDAGIDVGKAIMGFQPLSILEFITQSLENTAKIGEAAAKIKTALEDSKDAGKSAANFKESAEAAGGAPPAKKAEESSGPVGDTVKAVANPVIAVGTSAPMKVGVQMTKAISGVATGSVKTFLGDANKYMTAVESVAKLFKSTLEIAGLAEKKDPAGSIYMVAEESQTIAVAKKSITIAGEGIETWVPSVANGFQIVSGGGITLKSGLKCEGFSIQAVSFEGMLSSKFTSSGPVQIMSRLKTTEILGKEINIGAKSATVKARAADVKKLDPAVPFSAWWGGSWNPAVQQSTKKAQLQVNTGGEIRIHVEDEKKEISITPKNIQFLHDPTAKSSINIDKDGITIKTDKKIQLKAEHIIYQAKKKLSATAGKRSDVTVGKSTIMMLSMNYHVKNEHSGKLTLTHTGGRTSLTKG